MYLQYIHVFLFVCQHGTSKMICQLAAFLDPNLGMNVNKINECQ